ncbi:hypothetical protein EAG_03327 [Camponotus floridanus]|uniref:Uncharacterized protein n=1 Tax=Camponotus floridanus TaxID=104421 RepID=E1ZWS8_CAMFO|nr:hypothetical protein EAG_03327 [Camponotus floridanus]
MTSVAEASNVVRTLGKIRDSSSEVGGPPFFKNIHKCHAPGDNARSTAANAENVPVGAANLATYLSPRKSKFSMLPFYSTLDISFQIVAGYNVSPHRTHFIRQCEANASREKHKTVVSGSRRARRNILQLGTCVSQADQQCDDGDGRYRLNYRRDKAFFRNHFLPLFAWTVSSFGFATAYSRLSRHSAELDAAKCPRNIPAFSASEVSSAAPPFKRYLPLLFPVLLTDFLSIFIVSNVLLLSSVLTICDEGYPISPEHPIESTFVKKRSVALARTATRTKLAFSADFYWEKEEEEKEEVLLSRHRRRRRVLVVVVLRLPRQRQLFVHQSENSIEKIHRDCLGGGNTPVLQLDKVEHKYACAPSCRSSHDEISCGSFRGRAARGTPVQFTSTLCKLVHSITTLYHFQRHGRNVQRDELSCGGERRGEIYKIPTLIPPGRDGSNRTWYIAGHEPKLSSFKIALPEPDATPRPPPPLSLRRAILFGTPALPFYLRIDLQDKAEPMLTRACPLKAIREKDASMRQGCEKNKSEDFVGKTQKNRKTKEYSKIICDDAINFYLNIEDAMLMFDKQTNRHRATYKTVFSVYFVACFTSIGLQAYSYHYFLDYSTSRITVRNTVLSMVGDYNIAIRSGRVKITVADLYRGDGERFSGTVPSRRVKFSRQISVFFYATYRVDFERGAQWSHIGAHTYYRICFVSRIIPDSRARKRFSSRARLPPFCRRFPSTFFPMFLVIYGKEIKQKRREEEGSERNVVQTLHSRSKLPLDASPSSSLSYETMNIH